MLTAALSLVVLTRRRRVDKLAELEAELRRLAADAREHALYLRSRRDHSTSAAVGFRADAYTHAADLVRDAAKGE